MQNWTQDDAALAAEPNAALSKCLVREVDRDNFVPPQDAAEEELAATFTVSEV